MACSSCGPGRTAPENQRRKNPQNHNGCGCGGDNRCDTPSAAPEGSSTQKWEEKYGKLITTIRFEQNEWGRTVQIVEKKTCPIVEKKRNQNCTSLSYKVQR